LSANPHSLPTRRSSDLKVVYIQSETFVNDFINSIKNKTQVEFRNKYRNCDLLLVDDIQFFSKKEGIQEEFFHTFKTLYNDQKQKIGRPHVLTPVTFRSR